MTTPAERYERFLDISREVTNLDAASSVLDCDRVTEMPSGGTEHRTEIIAYLARLTHEKATSDEYGDLLRELAKDADQGTLTPEQIIIVRDSLEQYEDDVKLPAEFVEAQTEANTAGETAWEIARKTDDWSPFLPRFADVVRFARENCALRRTAEHTSPYEVALGDFDPGVTVAQLDALFAPLRTGIADLVRRIESRGDRLAEIAAIREREDWKTAMRMPVPDQEKLCKDLLAQIGFDFGNGRVRTSAHPFTVLTHPGDAWITVRYKEHDLTESVSAALHEGGHALYAQGIPLDHYGTTGGAAPSFGIDEGQALFYERVGRDPRFLEWFCKRYGLHGNAGRMHAAVHLVKPSLVRFDADEVTYCLHIIVRYEVERALLEGTLDPKDAHDAFAAKTRDLLGLVPTGYKDGVFQDSHWPAGYFGYFPSYALGNIYADQLMTAVLRDIPDVQERFAHGEFRTLREWTREKVHRHGGLKDADDIMTAATGSAPDPRHMLARFERTYADLYGI
jgi:carboxypeptidase Taq